MKQEGFKIHKTYNIILYTALIITIILVVYLSNKSSLGNVVVTRETEIPPTIVTDIPSRGFINVIDSLYLFSGSPLIHAPKSFDNWTGLPFETTRDKPYYTIGHIPKPYELSKKANNDTIVVKKDGYILKFLIVDLD